MIHLRNFIVISALLLLASSPHTIAHGHGDEGDEPMDMGTAVTMAMTSALPTANSSSPATGGSYFTYPSMSGIMLGHIVVMTIAWFFMLPIGM